MAGKHPRLRGEDDVSPLLHDGAAETPPLAWGRRRRAEARIQDGGNTPACAGKTTRIARVREAFEKHPRLRGEDRRHGWGKEPPLETPPLARGRPATPDFSDRVIEETPPLARGRPALMAREADVLGNTPACAGKTALEELTRAGEEKHPRLRGEDRNLINS